MIFKFIFLVDYFVFLIKDIFIGEFNVFFVCKNYVVCVRGNCYVLIYGGEDVFGNFIDEGNVIWEWDLEILVWIKFWGVI